MWIRVLRNDEVKTLVKATQFYVITKENGTDFKLVLCTKIDGEEIILKGYPLNDRINLQNDYKKISDAISSNHHIVDLIEE